MDAPCIAPSKVTQKIFAVLMEWYHRIVLTMSFKLVSFLHLLNLMTIKTISSTCSELLQHHWERFLCHGRHDNSWNAGNVVSTCQETFYWKVVKMFSCWQDCLFKRNSPGTYWTSLLQISRLHTGQWGQLQKEMKEQRAITYPTASSSMICDTLFQPNPTNRSSYAGILRGTIKNGSKSGAQDT